MNKRHAYKEVVFNALPGTPQEIHEKTGLARPTVFRWLKVLHEAELIHISRWRRNKRGGPFSANYVRGRGVDAQCLLTPKGYSQASKEYRARLLAAGELHVKYARDEARRRAKRMAKKQNTWLGALMMGAPA